MPLTFIIFQALTIFVEILDYLILARVFLSWLPFGRDNPIIRFIYALTEPILAPIRNMLQKSPLGGPGMIIDFSPIIAFFLIRLVLSIIGRLLLAG